MEIGKEIEDTIARIRTSAELPDGPSDVARRILCRRCSSPITKRAALIIRTTEAIRHNPERITRDSIVRPATDRMRHLS